MSNSLRLAFCLFNYFPFGGLQRDFLRIARTALQRGHQVDVYTMAWEGEQEPGLGITILPASGFRNHTRREDFVRQVQPHLAAGQYDLVVGFNKMPGLDVYYAADTCYQAKAHQQRSFWYRLTHRYRRTKAFEAAVFSPSKSVDILLISAMQQSEFMHYYQTPAERFHLLPPGIDRDRKRPMNATDLRLKLRREFHLNEDQLLILMVGSGFKTKGLDRALSAVAALPDQLRSRCRLFVIGKDKATAFQRQASQLGIADQVQFLGGRSDVPHFLLAADLLIHPAYNENTGTVLLEALVAGLPVLTTDVCGYAGYIEAAKAGRVIKSPFQQTALNEALRTMLVSDEREQWRDNALAFADTADIYSLPERAVTIIESLR
jgi:UDP-glucose:(heptosyl)LPS alpha-1,3-glucosyltransferase